MITQLNQPYVSVAEFRAAPTWLDSDDLIPGGIQSAQDAELTNVLLKASLWADEFAGGGTDRPWFGAHTVIEQERARVDKYGRVYLHPSDHPVRQVLGFAYGADFANMTTLQNLTQTWIEDSRGVVVSIIPWRGTFSGRIEFGAISEPGGVMFIQYQYVSGYVNTTLTAPALAGATSITVADPTGFQPPAVTLLGNMAGSAARLWDPGFEEAATVSASWVSGNPVLLSSGLTKAHPTGTMVSEFPAAVRQAIISYTVGLLCKSDVSSQNPFSQTPYGPTARMAKSGGQAGGLIDEARNLLKPYRRVK